MWRAGVAWVRCCTGVACVRYLLSDNIVRVPVEPLDPLDRDELPRLIDGLDAPHSWIGGVTVGQIRNHLRQGKSLLGKDPPKGCGGTAASGGMRGNWPDWRVATQSLSPSLALPP
jgi:hypothetical protein